MQPGTVFVFQMPTHREHVVYEAHAVADAVQRHRVAGWTAEDLLDGFEDAFVLWSIAAAPSGAAAEESAARGNRILPCAGAWQELSKVAAIFGELKGTTVSAAAAAARGCGGGGKKAVAACALPASLESSHRQLLNVCMQVWSVGYARALGMASTHRPGLTVTLTTEMFRKARPGDKLRLESRLTKGGKALGYLEMVAINEACGSLVARGRHVKYLPMGRQWDLVMGSPLLAPLALAMHERDMTRRMANPMWMKRNMTRRMANPMRMKGVPEGETLVQQVAPLNLQLDTTLEAGGEHGASGSAQQRGSAEIIITPQLFNFMGSFHGGAICAAAEQMAAATAPAEVDGKPTWIQHMETQYFTAQKKRAALTGEYRAGGLAAGCSDVTFLSGGLKMAGSRMQWGEPPWPERACVVSELEGAVRKF
ncbi:hypothetical protein JKP88DRAFT_347397 [Tribonema minus]|uniref:Thioesterase domain-containing protein n=1 Tax=Tribonema minus TaxID=303371 RepID=A0A836CMK8_9STRA|nr:hypothetical protein JKP88DRAFT_347397 [Tribonema minus]